MDYVITFEYDDEAGVWIATSDDIPGLVLESDTFEELRKRVPAAAKDLLSFSEPARQSATITIVSNCQERMAL